MDSKFKGNITELEVLTYATKLGIQVSIPFGDRARYDQIWDVNGKLIKVQVKTSHGKDGCFVFSCRSSNRRNGKVVNKKYSEDEIDYFATMWDGRCYLIPVNETSRQKTIRTSPTKSGRLEGVSFADDYLVEGVLKLV